MNLIVIEMSSAILKKLKAKQKLVDELKVEIAELESEFMKTEPNNPELVKEIFEKYGSAERLDHPAHIIFVTVATLEGIPPDDESGDPVVETLKTFFPLEGYIGRPGDCILPGHIEFTSEELMIFNRYNVKWKYSCLGQAEHLDNLRMHHK